MKKLNLLNPLFAVCLVLSLASACSTIRPGTQGTEIATNGPTIVDTKTTPATFEVGQQLQPLSGAQVVAEVKDFQGQIKNVRLKFTHAPIEMKMRQLNANSWVADLTPGELKQLAVSGHTMKYQANVIATDNRGQVGVSKDPVEISIKAADVGNS